MEKVTGKNLNNQKEGGLVRTQAEAYKKFNGTQGILPVDAIRKPNFKFFIFCLSIFLMFTLTACKFENSMIGEGACAGDYWPTTGWRSCEPEQVGMRTDKLLEFLSYMANTFKGTKGVIVIKNGYIVAEGYNKDYDSFDHGKNSTHRSFSVAKSVLSSLVGIAVEQGTMRLDDPVYQSYPEWQSLPSSDLRRQITIEHLLNLTSGLDWSEDWYNVFTYPEQDGWHVVWDNDDPVGYVLSKESQYPPGTHFLYSTGDPTLLSGVFEASTGMTAEAYANANLFTKIGMTSAVYTTDAQGHTKCADDLNATLRDYARFGYLFLNNGQWEGEQVVPAQWVADSINNDACPLDDEYAYLWHTNVDARDGMQGDPLDIIPDDTYYAEGIYGQYVWIIPSEDLVVATVSEAITDNLIGYKFFKKLIPCIDD
jgi:CubicO group peptidase (beta-lactamase class C family)